MGRGGRISAVNDIVVYGEHCVPVTHPSIVCSVLEVRGGDS